MRKFNGLQNWLIISAIEKLVQEAEAEVEEASASGKNLIYAPGYFTMLGEEITELVNDLTKKEKK